MNRFIHKLLLPGLRCLLVGYMLAAFSITTFGSAMGFEPVVHSKKTPVESSVSAEPTLESPSPGEAVGKMAPKSKPTSGPYLSLLASSVTKSDNESSRFNRQLASDCSYHQINRYQFLPRTITSTLACAAPELAHGRTLVGARPSGTM